MFVWRVIIINLYPTKQWHTLISSTNTQRNNEATPILNETRDLLMGKTSENRFSGADFHDNAASLPPSHIHHVLFQRTRIISLSERIACCDVQNQNRFKIWRRVCVYLIIIRLGRRLSRGRQRVFVFTRTIKRDRRNKTPFSGCLFENNGGIKPKRGGVDVTPEPEGLGMGFR